MILDNNSTMTDIQSWFIPLDILMIVSAVFAIILILIFLFIMFIDKTCHTVPMMLAANSCLIQLVYACDMLGIYLFTLQNDLKQIQFYDSWCIFRGYVTYMATGIQMNSYLLQAVYRYIIVVYPTRLFWRSAKFQAILICLTWICDIIYSVPIALTGQITYNSDDQICQMPLRLSFLIIFNACYIYIIPLSGIMLTYVKMVQYVQEMSTHIIPVNKLNRMQRELRMIRRIISLVFILLVLGIPYLLFIFMSFFNKAPKYHFRITFIFVNLSLALVMITLFEISEPVKMSIMKRINGRATMVVPTIT